MARLLPLLLLFALTLLARAEPPAMATPPEPIATHIYIAELTGTWRKQLCPTTIERILDDAAANKPEVIVLRIDTTAPELDPGPPQLPERFQFPRALMDATRSVTALHEGLTHPKRFTPRPIVVAWIRQAHGATAALAFAAPERVFFSDGVLHGVHSIEKEDDGILHCEQSWPLGCTTLQGIANRNNFDGLVARALIRPDTPLSYDVIDGNAVFANNTSRRTILRSAIPAKDDGLRISASLARDLGLSCGTADTIEQLALSCGIEGPLSVTSGKSAAILRDWSAERAASQARGNEIWKRVNSTPIEGKTPAERNVGRTERIKILRELKPLVHTYGEDLAGDAARFPTFDADINSLVEQLQQQIRIDKPRTRPAAPVTPEAKPPTPAQP